MRANTCSFNPGVIIANLTEWKNQNITRQLEHWMELNTQYVCVLEKRRACLWRRVLVEITWVMFCGLREDLYSKTLAESVTTPPLLIVFYKRHSNIDPMWHIRHLGKLCSPLQIVLEFKIMAHWSVLLATAYWAAGFWFQVNKIATFSLGTISMKGYFCHLGTCTTF